MNKDPKKFVRRIIALGLTGVFGWLACTGKIPPEAVISAFGFVTGFYFGKAQSVE